MAQNHCPHRFYVNDLIFDVTFIQTPVELEFGSSKTKLVTIAFAKRPKDVEVLAAKAIRNPKDDSSPFIGQRVAFKRLLQVVWMNWCGNQSEKEFTNHTRMIAFLMGLWDEVEE